MTCAIVWHGHTKYLSLWLLACQKRLKGLLTLLHAFQMTFMRPICPYLQDVWSINWHLHHEGFSSNLVTYPFMAMPFDYQTRCLEFLLVLLRVWSCHCQSSRISLQTCSCFSFLSLAFLTLQLFELKSLFVSNWYFAVASFLYPILRATSFLTLLLSVSAVSCFSACEFILKMSYFWGRIPFLP